MTGESDKVEELPTRLSLDGTPRLAAVGIERRKLETFPDGASFYVRCTPVR
jgi:hypothetical protein